MSSVAYCIVMVLLSDGNLIYTMVKNMVLVLQVFGFWFYFYKSIGPRYTEGLFMVFLRFSNCTNTL